MFLLFFLFFKAGAEYEHAGLAKQHHGDYTEIHLQRLLPQRIHSKLSGDIVGVGRRRETYRLYTQN